MRALIALALLASCSPARAPEAASSDNVQMADMTYHCTMDGREIVVFDLSDGRSTVYETNRHCDYEAWRADVEANGPVHSRERPSYREWLALRESET
jgi:hypothetical protein